MASAPAIEGQNGSGYMQFSVPLPLTFDDVFETPLFTVTFKFAGAVAVMVELPVATHVATPLLSPMVAMAVFDDFHVRPSAAVNCRLVWSVKFPVAVKVTVWVELTLAFADEGLTVMLVMVGCPAPQPTAHAARSTRGIILFMSGGMGPQLAVVALIPHHGIRRLCSMTL
jgi:hypothetical protein